MALLRRPVFYNPHAQAPSSAPIPASRARETNDGVIDSHSRTPISAIRNFHLSLPSYAPTPLTSLPNVAAQLGVRAVYVKDESSRLGLPAFKILGASWGAYRAISAEVGIPLPLVSTGSPSSGTDGGLARVAKAAQERRIVLYAATEGNHGRAVAAFARMLGIRSKIYVPGAVNRDDVKLITSEGAEVVVCGGMDYDGAVGRAWDDSRAAEAGILVQDCAFDGYEEIPGWIVEGYGTMLEEVEEQLGDVGLLPVDDGDDDNDDARVSPSVVVTPVGVGSLAHAVVAHCKGHYTKGLTWSVVSVEPDTAGCLYESLKAGCKVSVDTSATTIMDGLNCGTVSSTAFEELRVGVDACLTVSDLEAHSAVNCLADQGVESGPCGAATLAALWKLAEAARPGVESEDTERASSLLPRDAVIVILNTEGKRAYQSPSDSA